MSSSTDPTPTPEITHTGCARCGTQISGLAGRYACSGCGWVNSYSEGHGELPALEDDPDYRLR
jgi:hypothetical protein